MLRLSFIALLGTAVAVGAAGQTPRAVEPTAAKSTTGASGEKREAVIVLQRSWGHWNLGPAYMLLVYADGRVAYIGKNNVKTKGLVEGRIDKREVGHLVAEAKRINFPSLRDKYAAGEGCTVFMEDAGSVYISILVDGTRKSIDHHLGCMRESAAGVEDFPPGLIKLEVLIDQVVNSRQWIE